MSDHLELRRRLYYAVLNVPKDLQKDVGKIRLVKSTGSGDRREAKTIAAIIVANWKLQFDELRGSSNPVLRKAVKWANEYKQTSEAHREVLDLVLSDEAENIYAKTGSLEDASQFVDVVTGNRTLTESFYKQWKAQLSLTPKTVEQYAKDAQIFVNEFPTVEEVTKARVSLWLDRLSIGGVSKLSQVRILKGCRSFWKFIGRYDIKGMVEDPFYKVITSDKTTKKNKRQIFEADEIATLWRMAIEDKDQRLADLIALGAYTGARIEELCSLKIDAVSDCTIKINDSKTSAGIRTIPIHNKLKPVIDILKESSEDGYLISGLSFDKHNKRSGAMSKRFTNLKTRAGHGEDKVFHSLRHTLITNLVNLGVGEFIIADIVGHEKRGVTGQNYVKTIKDEVKKEAIDKIEYPIPRASH